LALQDATLRFEMRFEARVGGGSMLTQRVSLFGPNAAAYLDGVEAGFATSLAEQRRRVERKAGQWIVEPRFQLGKPVKRQSNVLGVAGLYCGHELPNRIAHPWCTVADSWRLKAGSW